MRCASTIPGSLAGWTTLRRVSAKRLTMHTLHWIGWPRMPALAPNRKRQSELLSKSATFYGHNSTPFTLRMCSRAGRLPELSFRQNRNDMALPENISCPRLAAGCRWAEANGAERMLLCPEGAIRLQGTGREILERCDG